MSNPVVTDREGRWLSRGSVVEFGKRGRRGEVTTVQQLWVRIRAEDGKAYQRRPFKVRRVA
jgi:hypothetical protein